MGVLRGNYPGHVPLNLFQQVFLTVGSGLAAVISPRRADLVATFGEMSMRPYSAEHLRKQMLSDPVGRKLLREKPRITSTSLDLDYLRALPPNSFGRTYVNWLDKENVSPDTRLPVKFIDNPECAYVAQRYRECHDFYHAIAGLPVFMEGEIAVKAFEFANLGIPMTGLAAISEVWKMPAPARKRLLEIYLPWAITNGMQAKCLLNIHWEEELEKDVDQLRREIGIGAPPDLRELRKKQRKKPSKPKLSSAKASAL